MKRLGLEAVKGSGGENMRGEQLSSPTPSPQASQELWGQLLWAEMLEPHPHQGAKAAPLARPFRMDRQWPGPPKDGADEKAKA